MVESARTGYDSTLIPAARAVNDNMPEHTLKKIQKLMNEKNLEPSTIGLLGLSFKANVSDTRNSPTLQLMQLMNERDLSYAIYDPLVDDDFNSVKLTSMKDVLSKCKIVVLCVGHATIIEELRNANLSDTVLVDPRYELKDLRAKVLHYVGLSS